jgi:uncharacterized protein
MTKKIYVNLPVADLDRSQAFFSALGFDFYPEFTNDVGACLIVSESIFVMLLTRPFFATFTSKAIADSHSTTEVLVCLSCGSRAEVDELVQKAVAAGGKTPRAPQEHDSMYGHGFEDLDGHIWELIFQP